MNLDFIRSIAFAIPGHSGSPAVNVFVREAGGTLKFQLEVQSTPFLSADLRALFFNTNSPAILSALAGAGPGVTDFATGDVIDLGHGANLHGAANGFDVGLEFGTQGMGRDDIQAAAFTLSHPTHALSLDDISNVQFGARLTSVGAPGSARAGSAKLVATAPAAPDAKADATTIFEDGAAGLAAPTHLPAGQLFQVLANDSDADGNVLTITALRGVAHGSAVIVDGADADSVVGDAVLYTPDPDFAGADSFEYLVSDGAGRTDFARVDVTVVAVADVPLLNYEILAGSTFNSVVVRVSTSQTDADSSEYMDRIELSGIPADVSVSAAGYDPAAQDDMIVRDFVLTLPANKDTNFTLGITAVAKEVSNGDEQAAMTSAQIVYENTVTDRTTTFAVQNQSMWSSGPAQGYSHSGFYGAQGTVNEGFSGLLSANANFDYKLGLQSDLTVSAGGVSVTAPYAMNIESMFNKTTGWLHFETSSTQLLAQSNFTTVSPSVKYSADLVMNLTGNLGAGIHIPIPIPGVPDIRAGFSFDLPGANSVSLVDLDEDGISAFEGPTYKEGSVPLGDVGSMTFALPDYPTASAVSGNSLTSAGRDNFLTFTLDVDDVLTKALNLPANPFHPVAIGNDGGLVYLDVDLLNYSLNANVGVGQKFSMTFGALPATLMLEDGFQKAFVFGDDFDILDANGHDANGDGIIQYSIALAPVAALRNVVNLVLTLDHDFYAVKITAAVNPPTDAFDYEWSPAPLYNANLGDIIGTEIELVGLTVNVGLGTMTEMFTA